MICQECCDGDGLFADPKDPPLEFGPCLCLDCYIAHLDDEVEIVTERLLKLKQMRFKHAD